MPWPASRIWTNMACLALAPSCLAATQASSVQGVIRNAAAPTSALATAQWQPPVVTKSGPTADSWQIIAKAGKAVYLPGEMVTVTISLKNVSGRDQYLADSDPDGSFEFAVSCNGADMPATEYGVKNHQRWVEADKRLHSPFSSWPGLFFGPLPPGRTQTYTLAVNRFQDMTLDGAYKIVVKRDTSDNSRIVANPVYVQVGKAGV